MLTVHHLGKSQSERIAWLCEELAIPYELKRYERDPVSMQAPPEFKALHPAGAAPVISDGAFILAESGAIVEYVIARYGEGRLALDSGDSGFADYLYWFHFANGTLHPSMGRVMMLRRSGAGEDSPVLLAMTDRLRRGLTMINTRLSEVDYLAGSEFSAADIMLVFSLTTMRYFLPFDLAPYPSIASYLQRIGRRAAYQAAMRKADPDMAPLLA